MMSRRFVEQVFLSRRIQCPTYLQAKEVYRVPLSAFASVILAVKQIHVQKTRAFRVFPQGLLNYCESFKNDQQRTLQSAKTGGKSATIR